MQKKPLNLTCNKETQTFKIAIKFDILDYFLGFFIHKRIYKVNLQFQSRP